MLDSLLRILEKLPPSWAVAVGLLSCLGIVLAEFMRLGLAIARYVQSQINSSRAHQDRAAIAAATSPCNMPPNVVEDLRAAMRLQEVDVTAREAADRRITEAMAVLITTLKEQSSVIGRHTDKLIEVLARQR